ncbi:hypothetical protein DEO72_LG11g2172 [Vigna unguiculata]|uniref:Uncharacterized protein n=1 Tax=Vigna unguiculata TaxID=3917 RepID=A0A4D6NMV5_VIGUN|nr:hypothetical protein DEO72_LG11g2172 [Vigna unguiculata]
MSEDSDKSQDSNCSDDNDKSEGSEMGFNDAIEIVPDFCVKGRACSFSSERSV